MGLRTAGIFIISAALAACSSDKSDSATAHSANVAATKKPSIAKDVGAPHLPAAQKKWVPKEFRAGMGRFKDPGIYVDGKPLGILKFGELPVPLPPSWRYENAAVQFTGGQAPKKKIVHQRRYSFVKYLEAMHVDVAKIKEVHLYGGAKKARAVVIEGSTLRKGGVFEFRFGSSTYGKAIPACGPHVGDTNCPDNIRAIAVYVHKRPPKRKGGYFYLNGKRLDGIPYFGTPLRGGIRIYKDGPLVAMIKRRKLPKVSMHMTKTPDGVEHWHFFGWLQSQGVNTDSIKEAWLIHHNRRVRRIPRDKLIKAMFTASAKKSGEILFGDEKIPTKAIALHSKPVKKEDLPVIEKNEQDGS